MRAVKSFAAVWAAFWIYRLIAVPLIEPSLAAPNAMEVSKEELDRARQPASRLPAIAIHFQPQDWELDSPIVLESDRAKLLLKDYTNLGDGRVEIVPYTMLFYPDDSPQHEGPPRVIILQAPEGAILQFDEPLDLGRAKIGKLIGGELRGSITIRGSASRDVADDALFIRTRDVQLSQSRITTPHQVEFRYGPNSGSGRDLVIDLKAGTAAETRGPSVGELSSLELRFDVKLRVQPGSAGLLPGDSNNARKRSVARKPQPKTPVDVSCQGPFRFDLIERVATFRDRVDVVRVNAAGPADQMSCELLSIHFKGPKRKGKAARKAKAVPEGSQPFEPRLLEARGNPVVLHSPSSAANCRGERLQYNVVSGELVIDGPGWFQGRRWLNAQQAVEAEWNDELTLRRQGQEQVLSLVGGAQVRLADMGRLGAGQIHLWLIETEDQSKAGQGDDASSRLVADRMMAVGEVRIDGPQLTGAVEQLELWFKNLPAPPTTKSAPRGDRPAAAASEPRSPSPREEPRQRFDVQGKLLRMEVAVRGQTTSIDRVTMEQGVQFKETQTAVAGESPLVITGEHLEIVDANSPRAVATIQGSPAQIQARGMTTTASNIHFDRGGNRLWIDGPGQMSLPPARERGEKDDARRPAEPARVSWKRGMQFDGLTATCDESVAVQQGGQLLNTARLLVVLRRKINFADSGEQRAEVREIVCQGGVAMDSRTLAEGQPVAVEHLEAQDLSIDQVSGDFKAAGPGVVTSIRTGAAASEAPFALPGVPTRRPSVEVPADRADTAEDDALTFLRVDFQEGITGNMHRRFMTFHRQVKTVYGPVASWQDQIDSDFPAGLGPRDAFLTCDQLSISELAGSGKGRRPIALEATGNTLVEGKTFTGRASRMSYTEDKDLLIMEGDGRSEAQLHSHSRRGGPPSTATARKIYYWRTTGQVKVDAARSLDLSGFGNGGN